MQTNSYVPIWCAHCTGECLLRAIQPHPKFSSMSKEETTKTGRYCPKSAQEKIMKPSTLLSRIWNQIECICTAGWGLQFGTYILGWLRVRTVWVRVYRAKLVLNRMLHPEFSSMTHISLFIAIGVLDFIDLFDADKTCIPLKEFVKASLLSCPKIHS